MAGKAATEELELIELGGGRGPRDAGSPVAAQTTTAASDGPGLKLTGDFSMKSPLSTLQLVSIGGNWVELSRSQS